MILTPEIARYAVIWSFGRGGLGRLNSLRVDVGCGVRFHQLPLLFCRFGKRHLRCEPRLRELNLLYNGSMHDDPVNVTRSVKQKRRMQGVKMQATKTT